jgi:hypothetical protein
MKILLSTRYKLLLNYHKTNIFRKIYVYEFEKKTIESSA